MIAFKRLDLTRRQEVFDERKVCVFDVKRETALFAGVKFFL